MPQPPGISAMPTTLLNAALGCVPDRSLSVRGPDRLAAVVPMFDEEAGARRALASLLGQRVPVDEVVVSINGGSDRTPEVVAATLEGAGYARVGGGTWGPESVPVARWRHADQGPVVAVLTHPRPVSKADSINLVLAGGLVRAERVLVMDGDTVLDEGFVAAMRDGFYRLRVERRGERPHYVLEDVALQSGAVTSLPPASTEAVAHWVSAARTAEYAFATLVRRGQTARLGRGPTFGASRLYTVVGCGFVARRDLFPIPSETMTEDHDFTLQAQDGPRAARMVDPASLHLRGFRVVVGGEARPLRDVVGHGDVELRATAEARFEAAAGMATEDPPRLSAYLGQVERWVGGGLENGLKRALDPVRRRSLAPNVRFTLLSAQLENVAGLVLLLLLPALLGLLWPAAGPEALLRHVAAWLLADVAVTGTLVLIGAYLQARAPGRTRLRALGWALRRTASGLAPLLLLRPLNAVAYVTAATRVLPRSWRTHRLEPRASVTWERPRAIARTLRTRSLGVGAAMATLGVAGFVASAHVATQAQPVDRASWRALHATPQLELAAVALLPLAEVARPAAWARPDVRVALRMAPPVEGWASRYCRPGVVASAASAPRRLDEVAGAYQPLTPWGLLTLARAVPLLASLEGAATAYDVPPDLLLQLLLNESYLDPLAVGPTDDLGLSQVTTDALTLLRSISSGRGARFTNPDLFAGPFSVFDPDFSICAGAAKLAWARTQPFGADDGVAYARYINPWDGVVDGRVSDRHRPLVDAFVSVRPMVDALVGVVAAHRTDPTRVTAVERALLDVADGVARAELDVEGAYRRTAALATEAGIRDPGFYEQVLAGLYGDGGRLAEVGAWTLAEAP